MRPKRFMLIAGEASGDVLAAELVAALREELSEAEAISTTDYQPLQTGLEPRFFGAGGPRMAAEGVELALDMTRHSLIGLLDALKNYFKFRRIFHQLRALALDRAPDVIICVDFSGFNRRFAHAIRQHTRSRTGWFHDWRPKIIQYVSPQVWASRESRAYQMGRDYDLVLSIIPFEQEWYAKRVPRLPVEFVGHPVVERYADTKFTVTPSAMPLVLLLPGSRASELARHLPVMRRALAIIRATNPSISARMVLPDERLVQQAQATGFTGNVEVQTGDLAASLAAADVAIASTGTVTMECAYFGVPTVAMYKASWIEYEIGKRLVKVKYLAMPNLLANEELFPEFLQHHATPENIAGATLELLRDANRRAKIKTRLAEVVASLGGPGASRRAARAIVRLLAFGKVRATAARDLVHA